MPPIAARCGRQPPTGPSRSRPPNTTRTLQTATTIPRPRVMRIRISQPGADHENGERAVAAVSCGKMARARAFRASSCHRIQPHPLGWPALRTRRDFARSGFTRIILLSSRRRLLVRVSAYRRYAGTVCPAFASGLKARVRNSPTSTVFATASHASAWNGAAAYIFRTMREASVHARVARPASPDTRSNPPAPAHIQPARAPTLSRRARARLPARRIRLPC